MKLHILSDLHLEISGMQPHSASNGADVIVLAGDIHKGAKGIRWAREVWPDNPIIYVAGNHEFYGGESGDVLEMMRKAAEETGVHFLGGELTIDNVRFLGATLWTDFLLFGAEQQEKCMAAGHRGLNDFRAIKNGGRPFTPQDSLDLHKASRAWLTEKLAESFDGKTVVVTHHAPSRGSLADRFAQDPVSACFVSELDHLVEQADLWIHGHTHDSFDYRVGKCRVICNPRGYEFASGGPENFDFAPTLLVDI